MWITFLFIFSKSTLQIPFYVLQYNHSKEKQHIRGGIYYDKHSYYIELYAVK